MTRLFARHIPTWQQFLIAFVLVVAASVGCYFLTPYIGYRVTAFILLLTVSLVAISFDILPVLFTAAFSAFVWDFFFIPPRFALHVDNAEDAILLIMYFLIALISAVLTYKIRQVEKVARQQEERANAVKLYNTFLNSLSHELRTPIAAIIGATDNLLSGNSNLTDSHKDELVTEISKASLRLNQQVENLLNMSRLTSGSIHPKKDWVDIVELLHTVLREAEQNCVGQAVQIDTEPDIPLFKLDWVMTEQIVYNLVSNACIHTPAGANISVSAEARGGCLRMTVEDDGQGFPEDEIDFVFDKFYRVKGSKTNGTGLGLSIVKGFAEALGGTIHLQNTSPRGCRFTLQIPAETSYLKA